MSLAAEARAMGIRVPPHSVDAEQAVLGGLMLVPDKIESLADRLAVQDFYRKDHQLIYRAMLELSARGQPCDAVTLGEWFDANGFAQMMGGASYLYELAGGTASAANVLAYAEIIRGKSVRRQVIDRATRLAEDAYGSDEDSVQLVDRGVVELMELQKTETRSEFTLKQAMAAAYQEAQRARELGDDIPGIHTGLKRLDRVLGGWHDSDLIVVGYGIVSRVLRSAVDEARKQGIKVGLFRPISLWPFPTMQLQDTAAHAQKILTVELSNGQMVEDVKLAVAGKVPVEFYGRVGGNVPSVEELLAKIEEHVPAAV